MWHGPLCNTMLYKCHEIGLLKSRTFTFVCPWFQDMGVPGPFVRERRGSGPAKQMPKHNPCRPVGRNWKAPIQNDHMIPVAEKYRHLDTRCLAKVRMIVWNPKGIPTRSMENMKWYSPSQALGLGHWISKSTNFDCYKIWRIDYFLSDNRGFSSYNPI